MTSIENKIKRLKDIASTIAIESCGLVGDITHEGSTMWVKVSSDKKGTTFFGLNTETGHSFEKYVVKERITPLSIENMMDRIY